jgi:F-type H+-transporting ATPase subunit delta
MRIKTGAEIELVDGQGQIAAATVEKIEKDIEDLRIMLEGSHDFQSFAVTPLISRKKKSVAIGALASKAKFNQITINFLRVVAENGRLGMLQDVVMSALKAFRALRGEVEATVKSAYVLSNAQASALQKQLSNAMGSKVTLNVSVDKDLLGGMIVTVGSRMIDDSVRRKLDVLGRMMARGTS